MLCLKHNKQVSSVCSIGQQDRGSLFGSSPQHYTIFLLSIQFRICFMRLSFSRESKKGNRPKTGTHGAQICSTETDAGRETIEPHSEDITQTMLENYDNLFHLFLLCKLKFSMTREEKPWTEKRKHTLSSCGLKQTCPPACSKGYDYLMTSFRPEWTRLN